MVRVQCACFCMLVAGQWLSWHMTSSAGPRASCCNLQRAAASPHSCPPTNLEVGPRSHHIRHRILLAKGLLSFWLHWNCEGTVQSLGHHEQLGCILFTLGQGQQGLWPSRGYKIVQPRIKGLSLNTALQAKPSSFRTLTATMDVREQDGESYILSLSPSDDDWWPELHKIQDMAAEGILLVQESPLLASEGERDTVQNPNIWTAVNPERLR